MSREYGKGAVRDTQAHKREMSQINLQNRPSCSETSKQKNLPTTGMEWEQLVDLKVFGNHVFRVKDGTLGCRTQKRDCGRELKE